MENKTPTIEQVLDKVIESPVIIDLTHRYNNQVELSGWVLRKPKFIKHDKTGIESCSLSLYQINNANGTIKVESFSCMCYVKDLVEQFKKVKNVLYIATMGKVRHHFKYGDYTQITEIETIYELKIPLAKEWESKNETKTD